MNRAQRRQQSKNGSKQAERSLLTWSITPWQMNGEGGWKVQPVILVEGREPFYADHPSAYIAKLEELHGDPELERGIFWTFIGQLKDGLELSWQSTAKWFEVPK